MTEPTVQPPREGHAIGVLVDVARALAEAGDDPKHILARLVDHAADAVGPVLIVEQEDDQRARVVQVRHLPPDLMDVLVDTWCLADDLRARGGEALVPIAAFPLVSGGGLYGMLLVLPCETPPPAGALVLVEAMADLAAVALDKAFQTAELRRSLVELETSRQELARAERLRAVGQMATVLAHEVRNPLAAIGGALQILKRRFTPEERETQIIAAMSQRLGDLASLVDELLVFARPRPPVRSRLDVAALLEDVAGIVRTSRGCEAVEVEVDAKGVFVQADRGQLQRTVLNLAQNGAQAMEGGGLLRLVGRAGEAGCTIEVIDQGPGIPEDVRPRLFEPFFTTRSAGTGLGLALARQVAEAHGGSLDFVCPPEGGTVFTLTLP